MVLMKGGGRSVNVVNRRKFRPGSKQYDFECTLHLAK